MQLSTEAFFWLVQLPQVPQADSMEWEAQANVGSKVTLQRLGQVDDIIILITSPSQNSTWTTTIVLQLPLPTPT
jgi:hypothetical protein